MITPEEIIDCLLNAEARCIYLRDKEVPRSPECCYWDGALDATRKIRTCLQATQIVETQPIVVTIEGVIVDAEIIL